MFKITLNVNKYKNLWNSEVKYTDKLKINITNKTLSYLRNNSIAITERDSNEKSKKNFNDVLNKMKEQTKNYNYSMNVLLILTHILAFSKLMLFSDFNKIKSISFNSSAK